MNHRIPRRANPKHVLVSERELQSNEDLSDCIKKHHVRVVGAIYDLESGRVDWLK